MFECCAYMYVCSMSVPGACRGQERVADPLELVTGGRL